MNIISAIFTAAGQAVTGFSGLLANGITSVTAMFYDATDGLTVLGVLLTCALGVGVIYFGFRLIMRLIKRA